MKVRFLFFLACFFLLFHFCHKQTAGFQITKIQSTLPSSPQWDLPQIDVEALQSDLNQPFYYLGKGGQSYAFVSEDGKTVLKVFKMHNVRQYPLLYKLALPPFLDILRLKLLIQQKNKLHRLFSSSSLAFTELKQETGLIHLNLNPNPNLKEVYVTLVDKLGIQHHLSLNSIPFALQKRATSAFKVLKKSLKEKNTEKAKGVLEQIVTCLNTRRLKGISDYDPSPKRNIGLLGSETLFIDIGGFVSEQEYPQENPTSEIKSLRGWLVKRSVELALYLDTLVEDPVQKAPSPL